VECLASLIIICGVHCRKLLVIADAFVHSCSLGILMTILLLLAGKLDFVFWDNYDVINLGAAHCN
jgi:hypothetical protein